MKRLRNLLCGMMLACFALLPASCSRETNVLGRKGTHLLSAEYLNSQAAAAYEGEKKKHKPCANPQHDRVVKRVAQRLIAVAERDYGEYCEGFEWEVNCFEAPKTVNAYAMPGGKIGVYTGILPVCRNEAGVAAVMGHEVSHALLRHGSERISRQLGVSAGMIAVAVGLGQSKMNDRNQQIILAGLGLGSQVGLILPFSRKHEAESDRLGVIMMAKAGYDPSEAPEIWVRMADQPGGQPPEFLSTHPSHGRRTAELTALLPEAEELYAQAKEKHGKGETLDFGQTPIRR